MKFTIGKLALSLVLILAFVAITAYPLARYNYDDDAIITEVSENGIGKIDIEIKGHRIFMNIHLNNPMSCQQVISKLGVTDIEVDGRTYSPICDFIDYTRVRIHYEELTRI